MKSLLLTAASLVLLTLSITKPVNAALITLDDKNWNITWNNESFNNLNADSSLEAQPWWGSESLAVEFSNELGYLEDYDDDGGFGPKFAFASENSTVSWANTILPSGYSVESLPVADMSLAYAYAELIEPILVNGQAWDISWVIGSFNELNINNLLDIQPWWENESLAVDFSLALGYMDDGDIDQGFGPKFAFDNSLSGVSWVNTTLPQGYSNEQLPVGDMALAYAFATRVHTVSEPKTILMMSLALLFVFYKRRPLKINVKNSL